MASDRREFLGGAALAGGALIAGKAVAEPMGTPATGGSDTGKPGEGGFGLQAVQLPPGAAVVHHDPHDAGTIPVFRYPLDRTAPKRGTGGYAKEMTEHVFPTAEAISGVHMLLNPGAVRELHWHAIAAEWAYVIAGRCQTTVLTPEGASEINNFEPGDLWLFPKGHGHSIQTIGDEPCHFLLVFDNGDTSPEHETFGITDWINVTPPDILAANFGVPPAAFADFPKGEVYIQQGQVLPASDALDVPWPRESTHKFRLMHEPRAVRDFAGGTFRLAGTAEWPISRTMSGGIMTIRPGAMLELHWHPNSNELNYFLRGEAAVSLFGSGGRSGVTTFSPGDLAYYPQGFGHAIHNIGDEDLEIVQVWDNGAFEEIRLRDWVRASPRALLANNFAGVPDATIAALKRG